MKLGLIKTLVGASVLAMTAMSATIASADYTLNILHFNDFHARFESINKYDSNCSSGDEDEGKCFGSISRMKTLLDTRRAAIEAAGGNSMLVIAGDMFQGSLFYTTYKGKASARFLNRMGVDAFSLGNHEFDDGPEVLGEFIDGTKFPIISGNTVLSSSSSLSGKLPGYTIVEKGGEKIAVVGVVTTDTAEIAAPGDDILFDTSINYLSTIVPEILATGVNKIVVVSHVGLAEDIAIAKAVPGIDVIVGGHSNSFLSNISDREDGPYPMLVEGPDGGNVPIVSAYAYGKYLGELRVHFDDEGNVTTSAGEPHLIDASIEKDKAFKALLSLHGAPLEELKNTVVGSSTAAIEGNRDFCRAVECEMGNLIADAMLDRTSDQGVTIAIQNGGGIRASIDSGDVTMGEVLTVLPFQNTLATFNISGADIITALENGVSQVEDGAGRFPQVAGLRFSWTRDAEPGSRIKFAAVKENGQWAAIDRAKIYSVATNNYVRGGGDGYSIFSSKAQNAYDYGPGLENVVADYLIASNGYTPYLDGRIKEVVKPMMMEKAEEPMAEEAMKSEDATMAKDDSMKADAKKDDAMKADAMKADAMKADAMMAEGKHMIVKGDTLWNLAASKYGDANMWTKIEAANPDVKIKGLVIGSYINLPE